MFDYVSLYIDKNCAEVKFIYVRKEIEKIASIIEEIVDDDITVDGPVWEQIFSICFEKQNILFDSSVLESIHTATTVIFYFDFLDYPSEEIIEQAEEFRIPKRESSVIQLPR